MISLVLPSNSTCPAGFEGETGSSQLTNIWIYNAIQIAGFFLVTGLTFTVFFSSRIKRSFTWYMFMIGWIVWCLAYFLLAGQQTGPCPAFGICLFQAALVYAGPPANACATVAVLLQLYFSISWTLNDVSHPPWQLKMVFAFPPFVFVLVFVASLAYGSLHPEQVQRHPFGMYCTISDPGFPPKMSAALVALFSIIMFIYEVKTFSSLYRNWTALRGFQITRKPSAVSVTMIVRVSIFSLLPVLALGLSVQSLITKNSTIKIFVTATLPVAAALMFGTQQDILRALMFWKGWGKHENGLISWQGWGNRSIKVYVDKSVCTYDDDDGPGNRQAGMV